MTKPNKYPLLRNLLAFQVGVVIASVAVCILVYFVATRSQVESAILELKKDLVVQLSVNQEKWRAWKYLNLDTTLSDELNNFAKLHSLASLSVMQRSQLQNKLALAQIVLPDDPSSLNDNLLDSDLVVVAEIDTAEIYKHYSAHGFVYYFLVAILIVFIFLILISGFYLYKYFYLPIWSVLRKIQNSVGANTIDLSSIQASGELKEFIIFLSELLNKYGHLERQNAIVEIASQVSHDIRSPLSALSLITNQLAAVPEEKRIIIRSAVNRINDIANQLLQKSKEIQKQNANLNTQSTNNNFSIHLLSPIVDSIVSEKRIQFREKQSVIIESDVDFGYGLFAEIDDVELKRVISNLVNNSVESFPNERGTITVSVRSFGGKSLLTVQDNGKGIPESILSKLGGIGQSFGKEGSQSGNGLGLYHAKKTIEEAPGKFEIQSKEGQGTKISMIFNKSNAPKWFVEKLVVYPNMQIISLDDDISIHQIWKGRFESKNCISEGVCHLTFTSGSDFKIWIKSQEFSNHQNQLMRMFLIDYELLNQMSTGLDIIEELGIGQQSILVTSRYGEDNIRYRCEKLGIKMIPKAMAGYVPIEIIQSKQTFDAILLDDDMLVHECWKMYANENKKSIKQFTNVEEFMQFLPTVDLQAKIYVDSNLGPQSSIAKGEDILQKLNTMGFQNLYLCTGYEPDQFANIKYIKAVVGKEPTF